MKNQTINVNPSTFQELAGFLNALNSSKFSQEPLLKKTEAPLRMLYRLEKQLAA